MPPSSRTVFVLKPSSLGDIVHVLPAVARLKAARPEWRLSWLINPEWAPLLEKNSDVDEIVLFPRREFRGPAGWARAARWLRARIAGRRPELALDFQGLLRTALLARASGARAVHGLDDAREGARWFYHRIVPAPTEPVHAVERYLALVEDLPDVAAAARRGAAALRFPLPPGEPVEEFDAGAAGEFIALHPFARGAGKSLSPAAARELCRRLTAGGRRVILVGRGPAEAGGAVEAEAGGAAVVNLLNRTTLAQLIWLLRRAAFVVSVDSGPMHIAAALTSRVVGIHGWSDPRRVGPHDKAAWVWKNGNLLRVDGLSSIDASMAASPRGARPLETAFGARDAEAVAALVLREAAETEKN